MSIHRSGLLSDASLFSRLLRTDVAEGGGHGKRDEQRRTQAAEPGEVREREPAAFSRRRTQSVPFSAAKTAVSPLASVPSKRQVASASSTSLRMSRRRGRAP